MVNPQSNAPEVFQTEAAKVFQAEAQGQTVAHAEPVAFGLEPYQWVSVAMLALLGVLLWKKVPNIVAGGLDKKIAEIKAQLDEAKTLRAEAEKLRDEYSAKIANAEKDAEAMMENARHEADALLEKAEAGSKTLVKRCKKMAEDKIAAAERDAVDELRATAAAAAAAASRKLIAEKHDAEADKDLADAVIAEL